MWWRLLAALGTGVWVAACGVTPHSGSTTASPTAPTAVARATDVSRATASESSAGRAHARVARASPIRALAADATSSVVAFPPRNESFAFRLDLEQMYRTELGRAPVDNYVDVEGDLVWTQEYLRYRVNGCGHLEAAQRVFDQIDRGPIAPVCGAPTGGGAVFPPYGDTAGFRQQLDARYRDVLRRTPSPAFVDAEGAVVWTQEYLQYRVSGCDDATSQAAVRTAIRGGVPPPLCDIRVPERGVLGHWQGIINMPAPRPFTLDITAERGGQYVGTYVDYVPGAVELTWDGLDRVQFIVHFPDGAMWFDGRFVAPDRVKGLWRGAYVTSQYDFDMTRD
jgi:hypothetical protein